MHPAFPFFGLVAVKYVIDYVFLGVQVELQGGEGGEEKEEEDREEPVAVVVLGDVRVGGVVFEEVAEGDYGGEGGAEEEEL